LCELRSVRETLEEQQIAVYFAAVAVGVLVALTLPGAGALEAVINPALAIMLFATFLQVPFAELRQALGDLRFLAALMAANFAAIPLVVGILFQLVPDNPLIQLGVLLVLLTPCIDYVVTFAYLGRADARLLLAATPALLIVQMLLLPAICTFSSENQRRAWSGQVPSSTPSCGSLPFRSCSQVSCS
jgi:ACR3 family arsenite transporter